MDESQEQTWYLNCAASKRLFTQIHLFLVNGEMSPNLQPSWNFNMFYNRVTSSSDKWFAWDVCLTNSSTYLKTTQVVTKLSWPGFTAMASVVCVGDWQSLAPLTSAKVMRLKLYSLLENRQFPRAQESQTNLTYCQAPCHKPRHVVRDSKESSGLLFYYGGKKKDFLIAISNMPSFFKVLHKGLG